MSGRVWVAWCVVVFLELWLVWLIVRWTDFSP